MRFGCSHIDSYQCRKLYRYRRSRKRDDLSPNNSSLILGTKIVEVSGLEVRVFSILTEGRNNKTKALIPKRYL